MCLSVLPTCMNVPGAHGGQKSVISPGTGVINDCEALYRF